jgi:hypothetical protein
MTASCRAGTELGRGLGLVDLSRTTSAVVRP